ncbi:MAG: type II toxin-antitoxin system RelE/ParE family toxin [Gammaproteobacteria bacterium]|nr:type II toxin-antitoxin system RelE/ParE family toxin [Gammaproteobacteria bacterium]
MVIKETSIFTKQIKGLVSDDEYSEFQNDLIENPELGDIIKKSGGIRKVRMAAKGRGKSGGARVLYYWIKDEDQIFMLLAYAKSNMDNISDAQLEILRKLVEEDSK